MAAFRTDRQVLPRISSLSPCLWNINLTSETTLYFFIFWKPLIINMSSYYINSFSSISAHLGNPTGTHIYTYLYTDAKTCSSGQVSLNMCCFFS